VQSGGLQPDLGEGLKRFRFLGGEVGTKISGGSLAKPCPGLNALSQSLPQIQPVRHRF
jgi:hypothetical protein